MNSVLSIFGETCRRFPSSLTALESLGQEEWDKLVKSKCTKLVDTQSCNFYHRVLFKVLT